MSNIPENLRENTGVVTFYLILGTVIIVPALAYSYMKLNMRWLINSLLALGISIFMKHRIIGIPWAYNPDANLILQNAELLIMSLLAIFSLGMTELYRRSHHYLITTARICTSAGVFSKRERTLPLSKVNDVYKDQGFVGRVFGFGTIIPLTASGMGMGSDFGALAGTVAKSWFGLPTIGLTLAGGHSIQVPKSRTHEALFGIPHPDRVVNHLMELLVKRELKMNQ